MATTTASILFDRLASGGWWQDWATDGGQAEEARPWRGRSGATGSSGDTQQAPAMSAACAAPGSSGEKRRHLAALKLLREHRRKGREEASSWSHFMTSLGHDVHDPQVASLSELEAFLLSVGVTLPPH